MSAPTQREARVPRKVVQVELARGLAPVWTGGRYAVVCALVRHQGVPLGWVDVPCDGRAELGADAMREAIERQLGALLPAVVLGSAAPPAPGATPPISVVVCTRGRPELLDGCLAALAALDYPEYEVLVVDNGGGAEAAARAERRGARYVREERPGLDWARNRGIAAARHGVVAFTGDDARPDPGWLRTLGTAFADPAVMAVTGPVVPLELETPAQERAARTRAGAAHDFERRRLRRAELRDEELLAARGFGLGVNMAFRRSVFDDVRPFDPALDAGTDSGAGGDVELLHRLVARGHTLVYEPSALVWRLHPRDEASLRRRRYEDGSGFASYLLTCWRNRTVPRRLVARYFLVSWLAAGLLRRLVRPGHDRRRLILDELRGVLASPFHYRAARARARRAAGVPRGGRATPARLPALSPDGREADAGEAGGPPEAVGALDVHPGGDGGSPGGEGSRAPERERARDRRDEERPSEPPASLGGAAP